MNGNDQFLVINDAKCFQILVKEQEIVVGNSRIIDGIFYKTFTGYLGVILAEK